MDFPFSADVQMLGLIKRLYQDCQLWMPYGKPTEIICIKYKKLYAHPLSGRWFGL